MSKVFNMSGGGGSGIKLDSIKITTAPTKTAYKAGETFSTSGMVVTAVYSNGATAQATGYTFEPSSALYTSDTKITITYTESGVTKTVDQAITVTKTSVTVPTQSGSLTYNGSSQNPTWSNYNTTYMTLGGTTTGTNAGSYTATFTLTDTNLYTWADSTTTAAHNVTWSIGQKVPTFTVNPTSVTLNTSTTQTTVTLTTEATATPTVSTSDSSVATATINTSTKIITIESVNSTTGTATITVSVDAGGNFKANSTTISVNAAFWSWEDNDDTVGDASWWATLKTKIASMTADERKACVGKTKRVSLSASVLGITAGESVAMRCIGYDLDGTGTLAFQSVGLLPIQFAFGSSAVWTSSTAKTNCTSFYDACSAKDSIKTVSKGTCPNYNSSRAASVTYNDETVFLPSEREMGLDTYSSISVANSTTAKAECTNGYNASYQYYTNNTSRIKYVLDSTGTLTTTTGWYWERSRGYNSSNVVCYVNTDGTADYAGYSGSHGLAPAFVIG